MPPVDSAPARYGGVAQLVERFGRIEEARGSIPLTSTASNHGRLVTNRLRVIVCFLVVALAAVACSSADETESRYEGLAVAPSQLREIPQMVLPDTSGNDFHLAADTEGKVRLVYQLFTNCPDICGVQLAQLASVLRRPGAPGNVEVLAVTVDPDRDTPEILRAYLDQFSADFIGLVPESPQQLTDLQNALGSLASIKIFDETTTTEHGHDDEAGAAAQHDHGAYDVAHDGRVFAFAPNGYGYAQYPYPTRQSEFDHDLPILAGIDADAPAEAGL